MKPSFFVAAAVAAAFAWRRRRHLEPPLLIGLAIFVVGCIVYGSGLVHPPDLEKLLEDLGRTLGQWTYLAVGVLAFLETGAFIGLLAPGETAIMVGGLVAGQGEIQIVTLIAIVWTAAVAGDVTSFFIGRKLGREFLVRHGPRFQITAPRLAQVEGFFERHGGKAVLIGRFVGIVRAVAPFLAGSSGMKFRRFLPYDIIGAGLWGATFCLLGYAFWRSFDQLVSVAKQGAFALGSTITVVVVVVVVVRWLRDAENRDRLRAWLHEQEQRPLVGPVARLARRVYRRVRGPVRFLWDRVTPGQLGLELTTLVAIVVVGLFNLMGPLLTLRKDAYVAGDLSAFDVVRRLRHDWLNDVAIAISDIGQLAVSGSVLVLAAVVLLARRRLVEGAVLLSGMVLTVIAVDVIKEQQARPRPLGALIDVGETYAYPSGHAAYGVAFVAVAVAVSRALPGPVYRALLVVGALVLATAVALSRVYLRAHYLSDVLGGVGLAMACFGLCGMVGLIVAFLRNNAAGDTGRAS
ncbi:VTT domain-containing protein [Paraconexibacter sp.]|uniref:VTT domain-containing protein n=1 Tax=Paraconexibacter sp. TaxID=2949640 RepID=UPI003562F119